MRVAILVITHNNIGQSLIETAASMLGNEVLEVKSLSIPAKLEPQNIGYYADQIRDSITDSNSDDGVLILTDIYGATPNNLARYFGSEENVEIVSGLNLPMLLRVLNYHHKPLSALAQIAIEGGHKGIQPDS